jgi:predicted transcriptional regulator
LSMSKYVIDPTEEQEKIVTAFLEALDISFEKEDEVLPPHVLEGIARGQAEIAAGNFITHEEFKKRIGVSK